MSETEVQNESRPVLTKEKAIEIAMSQLASAKTVLSDCLDEFSWIHNEKHDRWIADCSEGSCSSLSAVSVEITFIDATISKLHSVVTEESKVSE